jgi:hypothetical protein
MDNRTNENKRNPHPFQTPASRHWHACHLAIEKLEKLELSLTKYSRHEEAGVIATLITNAVAYQETPTSRHKY